MDKGSFFFAMKCGSCHPGDQAVKYDRNGYPYWDGTRFGYQQAIADGKYTGPIVANPDGTYSNVKLDGDYGWVFPGNRLLVPGWCNGTDCNDPIIANANKAVPAPWNKTGGLEADCLLCHANLSGLNRMDQYGNNLAWMDRAAANGAQKFPMSANATMGWTNIVQCPRGDTTCDPFPQSVYAKNMMPMNFPPTVKNIDPLSGRPNPVVAYTNADGSLKAGLVEVDAAGTLAFADGAFVRTPSDQNCQGCHAFPDIKKSGKLWMPGHPQKGVVLDAHFGRVGCVGCHPSQDGIGHNIAKGDATIGNVRNDLDGAGFDGCNGCHSTGKLGAPDPNQPHLGSVAAANHRTIPPVHFTKIECTGCHVPYLRWAFHPYAQMPVSGTPLPMITDVVYDMATNGTQLMYPWAKFMGDDPLAPSVNQFTPGATPATYTGSYKWYPGVVSYKGRLTTVKPALSAWFGDWLPSPSGDLAVVKPLPLRLVRKAVTASYGQYAYETPTDFNETWIQTQLVALGTTVDVDTGTTFGVARPVLVKAGRVYYLDASNVLQHFESAAAESHDFGVSHDVTPLKRIANGSDGPYGTNGCGDCHAPNSPFFYGQRLVEFASPTGPVYTEQYKLMGYSDGQVAQLAGAVLTIRQLDGRGSVTSAETGKWWSPDGRQDWVATQIDCGTACTADFSPPALNRKVVQTVSLTATPPAGYKVKSWSGCATSSGNSCSVTMNQAKFVYVQYEEDAFKVTVIRTGTGSGTVARNPVGTESCLPGISPCNTFAYPTTTASVTLTATPATGSRFTKWMGCPTVSGATCTVTGQALVYAVFDAP